VPFLVEQAKLNKAVNLTPYFSVLNWVIMIKEQKTFDMKIQKSNSIMFSIPSKDCDSTSYSRDLSSKDWDWSLRVWDASDWFFSLEFGGFFEVSSVSGSEKENIGISNYPLQTKNKYFFVTVFLILIHRIHDFGPPGSISQRYGSGSKTSSCSGSGSFYHRAKILRKTLIFKCFVHFLEFLSLKNVVNDLQKIISGNFLKISFLLLSWRSITKRAGSGHDGMDPEHCFLVL
jgi:hypothetical protein